LEEQAKKQILTKLLHRHDVRDQTQTLTQGDLQTLNQSKHTKTISN